MKNSSLKNLAYATIKEKIINQEYPPNTFLNEIALSEEIGMSRTPIREALSRLEQENLVCIYPKRGVWITSISLDELNEIYQVRILIEPYIILDCFDNFDLDQLQRINEHLLLANSSKSQTYQVDRDIHNFIVGASNNRYFNTIMDNIYSQNQRLRILSGQKNQRRLKETQLEHLKIVELILAREKEKAARAMRKHLENSKIAAIEGILAK